MSWFEYTICYITFNGKLINPCKNGKNMYGIRHKQINTINYEYKNKRQNRVSTVT